MSEKSQKVIPEKAIGSKVLGPQYEITEKEALLYAVGIGLNLGILADIQILSRSKITSLPTNLMMSLLFFQQLPPQ